MWKPGIASVSHRYRIGIILVSHWYHTGITSVVSHAITACDGQAWRKRRVERMPGRLLKVAVVNEEVESELYLMW